MGSQRVGHDWTTNTHRFPKPRLTDKTWNSFSQTPYNYSPCACLSSVQFSRSVVSDSLRPRELQHACLSYNLIILMSVLKLMFTVIKNRCVWHRCTYSHPGLGAPRVSCSRRDGGLTSGQQLMAEVFGISPVRPQNPATKPGINWGLEQWFSCIFTREKNYCSLANF